MLQAAVTFASVILAAAAAYLAALGGWRRQQRREVYGAFVAAADDVLESLDLLLAEPAAARLRDHAEWETFRHARHKFDIAWGQVRLVAPARLAEHARDTGYALLNFERAAGDLRVSQARELRQNSPFLDWAHAGAFVSAARRDLGVESGIKVAWLRRIGNRRVTRANENADEGLPMTARLYCDIPASAGSAEGRFPSRSCLFCSSQLASTIEQVAVAIRVFSPAFAGCAAPVSATHRGGLLTAGRQAMRLSGLGTQAEPHLAPPVPIPPHAPAPPSPAGLV